MKIRVKQQRLEWRRETAWLRVCSPHPLSWVHEGELAMNERRAIARTSA